MAISDYPPFIVLSDPDLGVHSKLIFEALRKAGQPYEVKVFSWSRIKQMLNSENVCSFGWMKSEDRLKRWQFSQPYDKGVSHFWGRKDNPVKIENLRDIKNYKVGVSRSYSYGEEVDLIFSQMDVDESTSDEVNIRKLLAGRIDLFPSQTIIIEPILATAFPEYVDVLEPKFKIKNLNHYFVCNINSEIGRQAIEKINPLLPMIE